MVALIYISLALISRASLVQRGQFYGYSDMGRSAGVMAFENVSEFDHLFQQAGVGPHNSGDKIFSHVHSRNMKYGGYFAFSPLDKNMY